MKLMLKRLLITLSLVALLATNFAFFLPSTARAQAPGPWHDQNLIDWYLKVYDETVSPPSEIFGERYTAAQVNWIIWSILSWIPTKILGPQRIVCLLPLVTPGVILVDVGNCLSAVLAYDNQAVDKYLASTSDKSIVATIFSDRPLSGITYVKNIARKFKLIPEVKAQGFGFTTALDPILPMWRGSRDIAYTLFVLITIVFAFMIMFRVKISPQTVITVQSALPKLAVAIILVTFSYAIAGFLVDLMYVVIGLVALLANNFVSVPTTATMFELLTRGPASTGVFGLVIIYILVFIASAAITIFLSLGLILGPIAVMLSSIGIALTILTGIGLVVGIIILLLLGLLILWHGIRIIWMLLKAFVGVLLLTIFAPFQIAIGTLVPSFGFSAWVKSMVSNLAVFVVTGLLFMLSYVFLVQALRYAWLSIGLGGGVADTLFGAIFGGVISGLVTGDYGTGWPPLLGVGTANPTLAVLFLGVSLVIFASIPKAADIIKGVIEGRPFAFGTAIGQAMAPVGLAYGQVGQPIVRPIREAYTGVKAYGIFDQLAGKLPRGIPGLGRETIEDVRSAMKERIGKK